jgi:hypothetical protein
MAVLYRPVVFEKNGLYDIEEYSGTEKWADVMKDAPINVVLGAKLFFYRLGNKLSKLMMSYMLKEEMEQNTHQKPILEESGDGISQFMQWQKAMSEDLMRLPSSIYINASRGYNSKKKRVKSKQK